MRTILALLLALLLAACGATSDAPPSSSPDAATDAVADGPSVDVTPQRLAGQATWGDTCPPANPCTSRAHSVRGERGAATVDVDCSLRAAGSGYVATFRIASIEAGGNFDESSEGLSVTGFLPAVGQELRDGGGSMAAATIRGLGWVLSAIPLGPAAQCHVFIDRLASGGFVGRIACPMVVDTSVTPNRTRIIRGGATSAAPESGEFAFTDCALH